MIRLRYNEALQKAGLTEFSGTNILRHTMATITRKNLGLGAAQTILRHTTGRMSEEYAKRDVSEEISSVVIQASGLFKKSQNRATICDQTVLRS